MLLIARDVHPSWRLSALKLTSTSQQVETGERGCMGQPRSSWPRPPVDGTLPVAVVYAP